MTNEQPQQTQPQQTLAPRGQNAHDNIRGLLEKSIPRLREIASTVLKPERLVRAVLGAASRTPQLLECTPQSLMQCVMIAAQLGLEPNTPLGHFYLVPFRNKKTGKTEATPIIGYRGLVDLARRGGQVSTIEAHIVHERDAHEVKFGRELKLWHTPYLGGDAGKPIFGYAVATLKDGSVQAEVMTWAEIMKIRDRSRAGQSGPWVTDTEEMAKKTVFRRLAKWLPLSTEFVDALQMEEDHGQIALPPEVAIELPPAETAKSVTQKVREKVKGVVVQRADLGQTEEQAMNGEPPPLGEDFAPGDIDAAHDAVTGEIRDEPGSNG